MAIILSIETSTNVCSVALSRDDQCINDLVSYVEKSHASMLTILIRELLKKEKYTLDQIDAVAISEGPGSYTGLRIGVSTAKGICYALNKPLIAVNTLKALSGTFMIKSGIEFSNNDLFIPMLDARRMEVYASVHDINLNTIERTKAFILDAHSFSSLSNTGNRYFIGNGVQKFESVYTGKKGVFNYQVSPLASGMANLAFHQYMNNQFSDVAYFEPFYLKDFIATTPKKKFF
jgi:tRNA threonylcarbamoyladenosine biosynthesis protein TsaB